MSTPSDLTQSGPTLVYQMVNTANATLPNGPLSASNSTLGTPNATGSTPNTSIQISATAGQGYTGNVTVNYARLDIDTDVFSVLAPSGATVINAGGTMAHVSDVVTALNAAYNLNLQQSDVSNWSSALSLADDAGSATIQIAAGSLVYLGSLVVTITQQQYALSSVVTTTNLDGLTAPSASPTPSPSPTPA